VRDGGRQGCYAGAWFSIGRDSSRERESADHACPKIKNVARGRFEYSHSPDNRALTKPYLVTTYLVAN